ncbi:MAG: MBL fold metallo-hydrolase [Elusimicrobiales bacterium]|nr:MBL fold metallo-hydrolase [Elusimicrobiales bacterium]
MHHVNRPAPAPVKPNAVLAAALFLLAVVHFAPAPLRAQAFEQLLQAAPAVEVPYAPVPRNATVYTPAPGLNVYFLSVGQGDAIYLELPGGANALIDGGPSSSATGGLAKFLADKKVTAIDHVVLTHPHSDHYNGLNYVFSNVAVGNFYDTRVDNKGATGDNAVRAKAAALAINTVYPAAGDRLDWSAPGVEIKVFNACDKAFASSTSEVLNNCSIMLKLTYRGSSMLFTGDTEGEKETLLAEKYGDELRADVLKVGHHGSKYSSTEAFLEAVRPAKAYIEVGQNNYGHPTQNALERLLGAGAKVFRTDLDGTQEFCVAGDAAPVELPE